MCRWLAYTGEPLQPSMLILDAAALARRHVAELAARSRDRQRRRLRVRLVPARMPAPGRASRPSFRSIEPAWNDQNLREISRAVRSPLFFAHVRAAGGPADPADELPPVPLRELAVHAQRRDLAVRADQARPRRSRSTRRCTRTSAARPTPRCCSTSRSRSGCRRPDRRDGRRHPHGRGGRARRRRAVPDAGHHRRLGRRDALGVPLLVAGPLALAVPLGRHPHDPRACTRTPSGSSLFGDHAQVVVSEPLNDLPGAFLEVPESTVAILDPDGLPPRAVPGVTGR